MNLYRIYFISVLLVSLFFGLKPFDFLALNNATLDGRGNLALGESDLQNTKKSRGFAYTEDRLRLSNEHGISIRLKVTPGNWVGGLGTILSFCDEERQPQLIIGQWRNHLAIRSRRSDAPAEKPYVEIGHRDVFEVGVPLEILIESNSKGTRIQLDGKDVLFQKAFQLFEAGIDSYLVIGSNGFGEAPWHGLIDFIGIGDTSAVDATQLVEYDFNSEIVGRQISGVGTSGMPLYLPKSYKPLKYDYLTPYRDRMKENSGFRRDVILNTVGLIPLGLAFYAWMYSSRRPLYRIFVKSVMLMIAFSFLLETLQILLPSRDSSLLDLALNTTSGLIASTLGTLYYRKGRR